MHHYISLLLRMLKQLENKYKCIWTHYDALGINYIRMVPSCAYVSQTNNVFQIPLKIQQNCIQIRTQYINVLYLYTIIYISFLVNKHPQLYTNNPQWNHEKTSKVSSTNGDMNGALAGGRQIGPCVQPWLVVLETPVLTVDVHMNVYNHRSLDVEVNTYIWYVYVWMSIHLPYLIVSHIFTKNIFQHISLLKFGFLRQITPKVQDLF